MENSGYRDWLEEQRVADAVLARYEFASTLVEQAPDPAQANRAVLHTMAVNLCYMLADMDPSAIRESLLSDSDKFCRFINSLVRLAEGGARCEESHARLEANRAHKTHA